MSCRTKWRVKLGSVRSAARQQQREQGADGGGPGAGGEEGPEGWGDHGRGWGWVEVGWVAAFRMECSLAHSLRPMRSKARPNEQDPRM